MTVIIRGALAVTSGVLVLLPLASCTTVAARARGHRHREPGGDANAASGRAGRDAAALRQRRGQHHAGVRRGRELRHGRTARLLADPAAAFGR